MPTENDVIAFLASVYASNETYPVPTLKLAKMLCGQSASTKSINPLLYAMREKKLLEVVTDVNRTNPRWKLAPGVPCSLIQ